MGLDMYLTRKIYVGDNEVSGTVEITKEGKPLKIDLSKISYIEEAAGYWRKANQIHKWFVDNVQGGSDECQNTYVSAEKLTELLETCRAVVADKSKANALLPTQSGFFFGGTEYDENYFEDIENTIQILTEALENKEDDYYYQSSW